MSEKQKQSFLYGREIRKAAKKFYQAHKLDEMTKEQVDELYKRIKVESFAAVYGSTDVGEIFWLKNPQPMEAWVVASLGARQAVSYELLRRKPKTWTHDCDECVFLGPFREHDLYFCDSRTFPTVIARYGDMGGEYLSGLESARYMDWEGSKSIDNQFFPPWDPRVQRDPLVEAMHRAVVFGHIPSTEEMLEKELDEKRVKATEQWNYRINMRTIHGPGSEKYQQAVFDYDDACFEVEKVLIKLGRQQPMKYPTR